MSKKQKYYIVLFIVSLLVFNIVGVQITQGLIHKAYKPYKGIVVVIDAGHGEPDGGARFRGVDEAKINLSITKKLKSELQQLGMKVILTREGNRDLANKSKGSRKRADMKKRVSIINEEKVDLFISIHMNSYADTSVKGPQVFYNKKDEDAFRFAKNIQKEVSNFSEIEKNVKAGDYYILNQSDKIGVLLECGFLSNPVERKNFQDEKYQQKFVVSIKKGVMNFLQLIYE